MERKRKLKIIQISLVIIGLMIFISTYLMDFGTGKKEEIVSENVKNKIERDIQDNIKNKEEVNTFYNIQYSGLDASGNRYIIKSVEAFTNEDNNELINMKDVDAFFYFKDDTVLYISSNRAQYNNKTLDIKFFDEVKADYNNSKLYAKEAEYSNSKNYIVITNNVKIDDPKGSLFADKLIFDIKNQNLDITSFKDSKISANIDLNEKRF